MIYKKGMSTRKPSVTQHSPLLQTPQAGPSLVCVARTTPNFAASSNNIFPDMEKAVQKKSEVDRRNLFRIIQRQAPPSLKHRNLRLAVSIVQS